jgi:hypothetical protein
LWGVDRSDIAELSSIRVRQPSVGSRVKGDVMKAGSVETLRAVWPARRLALAGEYGTHPHETGLAEPAGGRVPVASTKQRGRGEGGPPADEMKRAKPSLSKP